jgi:quinol monooxygenase YgiN
MHAVITFVDFLPGTTEHAAVQALEQGILPQVRQAPGFVKGAWFGDEKTGHALMLFETEAQAQQAVQEVGSEVGGVRVTRSDVYRVHAEA